MTTFTISYRRDGIWQGSKSDDAQPFTKSHTLAMVKEHVFNYARELGHSRVLIYNVVGEEVEERTFGAPPAKGYAGNWDQ